MALEDAIVAMTKALEANTAALKAGGGKAASTGGGASAYVAKRTRQDMLGAVNKAKEKHGLDAVKAMLNATVGVESTKDVTDAAQIDKIYDAAVALEAKDAAGSEV